MSYGKNGAFGNPLKLSVLSYSQGVRADLTSSKIANTRYGKVLQFHQREVIRALEICQQNLVEVLDATLCPIFGDSREVMGNVYRCWQLILDHRGLHDHSVIQGRRCNELLVSYIARESDFSNL